MTTGTGNVTRGSRRALVRAAAWMAALGPGALAAACSSPGQSDGGAPKTPDLKGVTLEHWIANALTHPEGMA
jgi:hypothetical protein